MDLTATATATLTGISVRSITSIYLKLRSRIDASCERQSSLQGAVEVDESYFGPRRVRGKRGRIHDLLRTGSCCYPLPMRIPTSYEEEARDNTARK